MTAKVLLASRSEGEVFDVGLELGLEGGTFGAFGEVGDEVVGVDGHGAKGERRGDVGAALALRVEAFVGRLPVSVGESLALRFRELFGFAVVRDFDILFAHGLCGETPTLSLRGRPEPIGTESEFRYFVRDVVVGLFRRKAVCKVIIFCQKLKPLPKIYFRLPAQSSPPSRATTLHSNVK